MGSVAALQTDFEGAPQGYTWAWATRRYGLRRRGEIGKRQLENHLSYHLPALAAWFTERGIEDVSKVTTDDVLEYFAWLTEDYVSPATGKPVSSQTAYHRYAAACAFFKVMGAVGAVTVDPMSGVRPPKIRTGAVTVVREQEIEAVLRTCKTTGGTRGNWNNTRDRALLTFLYATGCRVGGVASLSVENLDLDHQRARVTEKGGWTRTVVFGRVAVEALDDWLRIRRARPGVSMVFTTQGGRPWTVKEMGRMIRRRFKEAGLPGYSAHSFRRGWATSMARKLNTRENDGGRLAFKELGGWKSWSMVERYVHLRPEDLEPMRHLTPDNDLDI